MLRKFSTENFRGFKENIIFDLVSGSKYEFNNELLKNGTINKAIVFGHNGSGKTNICLAIADIVSVLSSNNSSSLFNNRPKYKNLNNPKDKPTTFSYELDFDGGIFVYSYSKFDFQTLLNEKLVVNGKEVINCKYSVGKADIFIDYDYFPLFNGGLSEVFGNRSSIVKYLISSINASSYPVLEELKRFADGILWFRCVRDNEYIGYKTGIDNIDTVIIEHGEQTNFENFLKANGLNYKFTNKIINGQKRLFAKYSVDDSFLPDIWSSGTQALTLFYSWLVQLKDKNPSLVMIDEFDAYYHYKSAELVYKMLADQFNFQSILTSHNTYLMKNSITRPDCVFLVHDDKIDSLPNCIEDNKEIREAHNLEKIYRSGGFCE